MLVQSKSVFIFCEIFIIYAEAWLCMNYTNTIKEDTYMDLQVFRKVKVPSMYDCAARCLMSSACTSFNFDLVTRTCNLNSKSSTDVDVNGRRGFVFSDIRHWPKSLTGACSTALCAKTSACSVDRMGMARCEPEFQGCGSPPLPRGYSVKYDGHYLHAVANYTCGQDYKTCHNNQTSICRSSGEWDDVSGLCGQYRWTDLTNRHVEVPCGPVTEMLLTLHGTPTSTPVNFSVYIWGNDDILLQVRAYPDSISLKSRIGGSWTERYTHQTGPFVANKNFTVVITFKNGVYVLEIDGTQLATVPEPKPGELPLKIGMYKGVEKHELLILT